MSRDMRLPSRTAPSVADLRNKNPNQRPAAQPVKKKPPPRPPPPNFNKIKSKSSWNIHNQLDSLSLIDLSPPESPKLFAASRNRCFGGSVSSSFSSSTSSLASSKRSFEYETVNFDHWAINSTNAIPPLAAPQSTFYVSGGQSVPAPTIIRPTTKKNQVIKPKSVDLLQSDNSPPMPMVPPPSPPKEFQEVAVPYGIALYDYLPTHKDDLSFKVNEVIFLIRRVNNEWLYGRIEDKEGLFPSSYISIQVPLSEDDRLVTALYEFIPQAIDDLSLVPGQSILVTGRVSADWLLGESNGCSGQFPANFIDRVPSNI